MKPLQEDLQTPKKNLDEFADVAKRVLGYLPDIISEKAEARDYTILSSVVAGTTKFARPINKNLFIYEIDEFDKKFKSFLAIIEKIRIRKNIKREDDRELDKSKLAKYLFVGFCVLLGILFMIKKILI